MTAPLQGQIGIPQGSAPAVDAGGLFQSTWYQFFIGLWKRVGGGKVPLNQAIYLSLSVDGKVEVFRADDGVLLGTLTTNGDFG